MKEFDARVAKCSPRVQRLLDFLQTIAAHAGPDVEPPTFDGSDGTGITFRRNGRRFCRFDPKHEADHIWALIPDADRSALAHAGQVSDRPDGPWVRIADLSGAVRLVPEVLRAYDTWEGKAPTRSFTPDTKCS